METGRRMSLREPDFKLFYRNVDISSELDPHLLSCTYTDKLDGEADEIDVTVQDKQGLWRGPWCPEHGDTVELWIGYKGLPFVYCGSFEIDEPNARLGRGGDTFSFKGVSAPVTKAVRTRNNARFEKQKLKQVAEKIGSKHGMEIVGTPPDIYFDHVAQRRERDLEFLSRLAKDYGAYFAVKGRKLVFLERKELHERDEIFTIHADSDEYITADLKRAAHKTYSKAKASYFEGNEKKNIEVEVEDKNVKTGDTLRLDERIENEGQARALAKSRLEYENLKKQSGNIVMTGNPLALAGNNFALDSGFGKWMGKYIINSSRHHIVRAQGYTTNIEFKHVGAAKDAEAAKSKAPAAGKSNSTSGFALPSQRA